jgi:uncharacterized protein
MKIAQEGSRFLIRFELGESLPASLLNLAEEQKWGSASLTGLGAVKNVQVAYFDLTENKYIAHNLDGIVELISLVGNLSWFNEKPVWHLHATLADCDGNVKGGHLIHLEVAVTVECWIHASQLHVARKLDSHSGLNLLDL